MIHQLLTLTRPFIFIDAETTGTDPQNDRIVELGLQVWTSAGLLKEWRSLINPGIPIPPQATKVHKITDAMVQGCRTCGQPLENHPIGLASEAIDYPCKDPKPWPRFKDLAGSLVKGLTDCDFGGQNVRFDLRITAAEMKRNGVPWDYLGARIVDAGRLEQLAVPRSLSDLHEKYVGRVHDGAHGALSDVRASVTVVAHQLEAHSSLPRDLDKLHRLQWPGWIDGEGKFRFVDGVACFSRWGKYAEQPMSAVPVNYYDFILKSDFSPEVKKLAADAKLKKFPVEG